MKFKMFADFVHGKKYRERGLPCQDFAKALEFDNVQAIAVADGHGGKDYFRSDTGSRLAVEVAFEQIKTFCDDTTNYKIFSENGIRSFELKLWEEWRKAVKADWDKRLAAVFEVGDNEPRWENVSDKYKERYTSTDAKILERYIPAAYGTTLICAVSIGSQVLIVQVGDGSCVILQRNGEFKVPVPPDNENFANVTTSLCDADAYKKFRHVVLDCAEDSPLAPVAIFLSTDGLDDCYPISDNEQFLYKLYADAVIDSMINNGFDKTEAELRLELLPYMTEHGSNDDISLAYLVTEDLSLLKNTLEKFSAPVNETALTTANQQIPASVNETASTTANQQIPASVNETASTTANQEPSAITNEMQANIVDQADKVRERLLPLWWEERRNHHD